MKTCNSFGSFLIGGIFLGLLSASSARDFSVGGKDGWIQNPSESFNQWSMRMRFLVGDKLVFKYMKEQDSVLVVNKEDYNSCNVSNPIEKLDGGDSVFQLSRSGVFYFISGVARRCDQGQKLLLRVISSKHKSLPASPPNTSIPPSVSPSTTPSNKPPTSSPTTPSSKPPTSSPSTTPSSKPPMSSPSTSPSTLSPVSTPMSPSSLTPSMSPSSPTLPMSPSPTPSMTESPVAMSPSMQETPSRSPSSLTPSMSPSPTPSMAETPMTMGPSMAETPMKMSPSAGAGPGNEDLSPEAPKNPASSASFLAASRFSLGVLVLLLGSTVFN